jgi:parallel beta-helix repeat protein
MQKLLKYHKKDRIKMFFLFLFTYSFFLNSSILIVNRKITFFFGIFFFLFSFFLNGWTAIYYVDATNGNDRNSGLSPSTAWKTISKVNSSNLQPGDNILFKRGESWREQLKVPSSGSNGNPITFTAYGSGDKPVITGADLVIKWKEQGMQNVWQSTVTTEPRVVLFDDTLGINESAVVDLDAANEWYWSGDTLFVYSTSDPDGEYTSPGIETGVRNHAISTGGRSDITMDGLTLQCANHAVGSGVWLNGAGATRVTVQNCILRYNGYGILVFTTDPQNGNHTFDGNTIHDNRLIGISFNAGTDGSGSGTETTIGNNTIYNNYNFGILLHTSWAIVEKNLVYLNGHTGGTNVGIHIFAGNAGDETANTGDNNIVRYNISHSNIGGSNDGGGIQIDFYCDNNQVYYNLCYNNDGDGIQIHNGNDNLIYNNTTYNNCANSSGTSTILGEIVLTENDTYDENDGNVIKNNNCYARTGEYAIYIQSGVANFDIDTNDWYKASGNWWYYKAEMGGSLSTWNSKTGIGTDVNTNPLFKYPISDFTLQLTSPCINAGTDVGLTKDCGGVIVPKHQKVDIGAFEYNSLTTPTNLRIIFGL